MSSRLVTLIFMVELNSWQVSLLRSVTDIDAVAYMFSITDKMWNKHDTKEESGFRGPRLPSFDHNHILAASA